MGEEQNFRERRYRFSVISLGAVATAAVIVLSQVTNPATLKLLAYPKYAFGFVLILIGMWLFFLAIRRLYPTYAGPEGLRSYDGIGRYVNVRWDEIQKVSNLMGFLWIRHGRFGRALCVPIFLDDWEGFRDYVRSHTPAGNPLRSYLEKA